MDFTYSEDQRMLDDMLRRYLSDNGGHEERDKSAHGARGYNTEQWSALAELGIVGALFREEAGGFAGFGTDIALVFEALGNHLATGPFLSALMSGTAITAAGSHPHLLEGVIAGNAVIAFAHEEAAPGLRTTAEQLDGSWRLNGAKPLVLDAEAAGSFLVSASTEHGPALFLVPSDRPGVAVSGHAVVDGGRAGDIALDNVELAAEALIGEAGNAAAYVAAAEAAGLLALSAEALGAMTFVKDATVEYLRTRIQFGTPIGRFQALQHRMADMLIGIEQARSAVINAATAMEGPRAARDKLLSAAKFSAGEIGARVAEEAIQLHGGIGMTWELPLSHYAKRLIMIDHQLGDSDHHLQRYIACEHPQAA